MFAESDESTIIQLKVTRMAHLKAFRTLKLNLTAMETLIIQMTAKRIAQWALHLIRNNPIACTLQNAQSSGM
jgi:hypothetical protein